MTNIKIIQTRPEITNGWVVKADTKRFGKNEIMFEGNHDECWGYLKRIAKLAGWEKFTVAITGEQYDEILNDWQVTIHKDGFIEQDWEKLGF